MLMQRQQTITILALVALCLAKSAAGQEAPLGGKSSISALGVRQQRVERLLEDLERKFKSLSATLQQTEPERAAKLDETLQETRRLLLAERMTKITELLDQSQLDSAGADQKVVLTDIRQLLALLLDEQDDREKNREEYDRLNAFKKQLENVLQQERSEKREADRLANKDATLAALQARIAAVEALIEKQRAVVAATEAARGEGVQALGPLAEQQQAVRNATEKVAQEIAQEAGDGAEAQPSAANAGATPSGERGDSAGGSPPAGSSPMPTPAGDESSPQPGSPTEQSASPMDGQPAAGGSPSNSGQPSAGAAKRGAEPGEKALQQAAANQKQAEGNLAQGKGKAAQEQEETALANLQRALGDLKNESSRIASLPPEAFEKMAGKQEDLAGQTGEINESMKKPPKAGGSQGGGGESGGGEAGGGESGGGESGGGQSKPTPGQQKVQQAQGSMQKAAGDLRQQDPADAARQQQRAIKDLEEALREIEERLAQLREETQIEKLAKLEARFREMLARQQKATSDTVGFEAKRQAAGGEVKRSERLAIGKVAAEELSLAEASQQALDIIIEDGTSVVFADVVEQLRDDLQSVAKLLDEKRTEVYTSTLQQEVEITLEELIEALQKAQKQKEASSGSGGGGGGGGGGEEPLLPSSAELKLLRSAQLRINRRTVAVDTARAGDNGNEVVVQELQGLSQRQAEIGEMTIRILERGAQQ